MTCRPVFRLVVLAVLLAGPIVEARAQITITAQDARDFLAPGVYGQQFMVAESGETARVQAIVDRIGPGGTYDFSAVAVSTVSFDVGEVQARPFDASVPTDADFADADFVDVIDSFGGSPTYDFFRIEDAPGGAEDGYYQYGDLSSVAGFTFKTTYTPPLRAFPFPLTATTTWSSGDVTESSYTNGTPQDTQSVSYTGEVIGDGTLVLPGGRTLPTLVHRLVQVEGTETTTALSFVTKGQRDAVTVLTDGSRTVVEAGPGAPAAFFFLKSEAAAEAAIAQNTTGLFLGGALGATVELTEGSATNGQLRGYRIDFPSFNNAINDTGLPAGFPVENVSQSGYWVLQQENLDATYRVCLDFGGVGGIADASELAVLTRDSAAEPWRPLGSTVDTGTQQVCAGVDSFSEFAIGGSAANALPVELARFGGTWSEEGTRLTWETAAERNNAGFEVQRRVDGGPFATMGFVEGAGTSDKGRDYRFVDAQIPFAVDSLTYRLRQVDLDGTAHLHAPVTLGRGVPDRLEVLAPYPNPTTGTATLSYTLPAAGPVRIAVYNVLGQEVAVLAQGEERAGRIERHLDLSRLPSGAYFVRLTAAGQDRTQRLTVVR